jgi:uncharacterized membrane protein
MSIWLLIHICGAVIGLLAGTLTMIFRKGSSLHRIAGNVFVVAMLLMSSSAAYIAAFLRPNMLNHIVGVLTFYLVATGWVAGRRREAHVSLFDLAAMVVAIAVSATGYTTGAKAVAGTGFHHGMPAGIYFMFATIALICASADLRMYLRGGITGSKRIGRHLRRLGLAFIITVMSFYPGQAKLFSKAVRDTNLLYIPVVLAIGSVLFWMARVGLKRRGGQENMFRTTNQTFAGRSASRRTYQGNQFAP